MASVTPFHYTGILTELSLALQHALQANDWKEGAGPAAEHPVAVRQQSERGNLDVALAHTRNALIALAQREENVAIDVRLGEREVQEAKAPEIAQAIQQADESHLPPDLQPDA